MTSGNRVERLEEQVNELEATVQGLTEELVEANERIRQLEGALGGDAEVSIGSDDGDTTTGFDDAEAVDSDEGVEIAGDDATEVGDDLDQQFEVTEGADPEEVEQAASSIVAPEEEQADTANTEEDDSGNEGDDIIVA